MAVRESMGEKVPDVVMRERAEEDWNAIDDFAHEFNHYFKFPRRVNRWEARTLISGFFTRWSVKHPEDEIRYFELRELSASEARALGATTPTYETTIHVIHHSPEITVGAIAAAIASVIAWIAANVLLIAKVVALFAFIYFLWRLTDYFSPEEQVYKCPKDGEEFDSWGNFETHFRTMHPEQKVPPKPREWTDYLKYGLIAVGAAATFRIAYPAIKGK